MFLYGVLGNGALCASPRSALHCRPLTREDELHIQIWIEWALMMLETLNAQYKANQTRAWFVGPRYLIAAC